MGLRSLHRAGTMLLSVVMVVIGVALVVEAVTGLGGVSVRLFAGVLFVAAGVGRVYIETRRGGTGGLAPRGGPRRPPGSDSADGRANGRANGRGSGTATPGARGRRRRPRP